VKNLFFGFLILFPLLLPNIALSLDDKGAKEAENIAKIEQKNGQQVTLSLLAKDENGNEKPLSGFTVPHRPFIIAPVYFGCPGICTVTLNGLLESINKLDLKLGQDYNVLAYSFKPGETPPLALEKANNYYQELTDKEAGKKGWRFLTSEASAIKILTSEIGFNYVPDGEDFVHAPIIVILTSDGRISRYFSGIEYKPEELRKALVEASEGRIGTITDQIFLFCFRYDHLQGQYTLRIWRMIQIVSITGTILLSALLFHLRRNEKKRERLMKNV
jgi:protein SCO1